MSDVRLRRRAFVRLQRARRSPPAAGASPRAARTDDPLVCAAVIPDPIRARDLVGYGRVPPRFSWPDGARVVVNVVLVYEEGSEYSVLWGDDRNDGWRGIELWRLSRDEEREELARAIVTFERVFGERPLGWNCRSWPTENTRELLVEDGGFLYDSDGAADDLPYYARCLGRPFLVVPYTKTYNDSRYLVSPGFASPTDFLDTLTRGLEELLRDGADRPTLMTVAVHARWSGQAARAAVVRAFLEHALELSDVTFLRRVDVARWWLETFPPQSR